MLVRIYAEKKVWVERSYTELEASVKHSRNIRQALQTEQWTEMEWLVLERFDPHVISISVTLKAMNFVRSPKGRISEIREQAPERLQQRETKQMKSFPLTAELLNKLIGR